MWESIKRYFLNRSISAIQSSTQLQSGNKKKSNRLLFLIDAIRITDQASIQKYAKELSQIGWSVDHLHYTTPPNKKDETEPEYPSYSKKDCSFYGKINPEKLTDFQHTEYKYIICFYDSYDAHLEYSLMAIPANLVIGSSGSENLASVAIHIEISALDQQKKYIAEIKNIIDTLNPSYGNIQT